MEKMKMAPRGRFELPRRYRHELAGGKFPGSRLTGLGHLGTPAAITVGSFKTICLPGHLRLPRESLMVGLALLAGSVCSMSTSSTSTASRRYGSFARHRPRAS